MLVAAAPSPDAPTSPALDDLVRRTLHAYGGVELLSRVERVTQTGKVHSLIRHAGQTGALTRTLESADRLRVEISYPDGEREVRVLDGARGWRNGMEVRGPPRDAMVIQAGRLSLPLLLQKRVAELVDRGAVEREGKNLRRLELPLDGQISLEVEIDPDSGWILRTTGRLSMGAGGSMEFSTTYGDFRKVHGILFPFREGNYIGSRHTADTVLEHIEVQRSTLLL
jgi:hypothetical protein